MYVQNLKFVALPVPEIIGVPKKLRQSLDTPTLVFSQIFHGRVVIDFIKDIRFYSLL